MPDQAEYSNMELPVVTIFGAGIAGLSAAHELAERGFEVQVVEPTESANAEYECCVGGLAANQFTRVRAPLPELHPWLFAPDQTWNLGEALGLRDLDAEFELAGKRFPIKQKLRFDRHQHRPPSLGGPQPATYDPNIRSRREPDQPAPADWEKYWDAHGVLNEDKLLEVYETIRSASRHYMRQFFPDFAAALDKNPDFEPKDQEEWKKYSKHINDTPEHAIKFIAHETFFVRIVGYTDTDSTQEENRKLAQYWAEQVQNWLLTHNKGRIEILAAKTLAKDAFLRQPIWRLEDRLEVVVRGSACAHDSADPRTRSLANRVEFEVVEQVIPGEHGFRFFPGFYRHLFDTMRRTRCYTQEGEHLGSAYEQLVETPHAQLALPGGLYDFDYRKMTSLSQFGREVNLMMGKVGFTSSDTLGLMVRGLRFATSGWKRRQSETESINMIKYLGGDNPERLFSKACLDFIDNAPRALAAMSARESDARSQYSISIQLLLKDLPDPMTLNGPTSTTWLEPWKRYLKKLGVKFFVGSVVDMKAMTWRGEPTPRLVPVTMGAPYTLNKESVAAKEDDPSDPWPENPDHVYKRPTQASGIQHRFVLAAQFGASSDIAWKAREATHKEGGKFEGPFAQMVAFDMHSGRRRPGDAAAQPPHRDPAAGKEPPNWPSRTISGVQFFFPQAYRIGRSNVYFSFTPYALTSISQFAFWRQRSQPVGQLLGQVSIDLGDWHKPYPGADLAKEQGPGHPAYYSSSLEVAKATWSQVMSGLPGAYASIIEAPRYYHLDQHMIYHESHKAEEGKELGWTVSCAVRANAILRVPQNTNPGASLALAPGRYYSATLRVAATGDPVTTGEVAYDPTAPKPLRDTLFENLDKAAGGRLVLATNNDSDIVVSPVASLEAATLRVLAPSNHPFVLVVGDRRISVTVQGRGPAGVVEALAAALAREAADLVEVSRPAPDYLTLTPLKSKPTERQTADAAPSEPKTIDVGVLNVDRKIELVGAPTLIVKALNLEVPQPEEGFALLRNDYEYVIDVPGQWSYRAGLAREPGAMPEGFIALAQAFGVRRPEIYYGHPETCPLLEYWVGAGAHMATYTRMTTMEAANESGRHAAAALIYDLHALSKRRNLTYYALLAGDFPSIYPVEDYEIEDLEIFKKLDDILFDMGQPHLFELIGLSQLTYAVQLGKYGRSQFEALVQAAIAPLVAGLPGLQPAGAEISKKLFALLSKLLPDPVGRTP